MEYFLKHKEANGNYSVVSLSKDVVSEGILSAWSNDLNSLTFYGGKTSFGDIPREQMWVYDGGGNFGDRANWKDVENPRWIARPYNDLFREIQATVQQYFDEHIFCDTTLTAGGVRCDVFDSMLANKYRSLRDSIKPHRDSELIFGDNPSVGILSIGCPREIIFQRILYDKDNLNSIKRDNAFDGVSSFRIVMPSGSILFMGGEVQKYYSHEIKKVLVEEAEMRPGGIENGVVGVESGRRYSLTFRQYR